MTRGREAERRARGGRGARDRGGRGGEARRAGPSGSGDRATTAGAPRGAGAVVAGVVAVLLAPLAAHLGAVSAPFFADDYLFIDQVRGRSLIAVLSAPDPIGNFFRPVGRQLWFWIVTRLFGESPAAFHALGLLAFVAILALFFLLARGLAGARAALLGAALLAVNEASDVPVRWAAGSQDLLAVLGAMGALVLHRRGRVALAAIALLAGLLSKETVLFTPLIAIVLDRRAGESWLASTRRAWPLLAAVAAWAALWIARSPHPLGASSGVALGLWGPVAALVHLVQVVVGWEARPGNPLRVALAPASLIAPIVATLGAALALSRLRHEKRDRGALESTAHAVRAGIVWALLAAAPVAAVASIWSAYYYLFAIAGVALAFGAWAARRPVRVALGVLALLGVGSAIGRSLDDFALAHGPWTGQSHVNRFYIDRGTRESSRYLAQLERLRPEFPRGSTVFFAGVKGSVAFQTADGPLLRWAYRDPTLHSYYVNQFSRERIGDRPVFLFFVSGDSLEQSAQGTDTFGRIAFGFTINDRLAAAREALRVMRERGHAVPGVAYYEGWLAWALGDTMGARALFASEQVKLAPGPTPQQAAALAAVAAGDTMGAAGLMRQAIREHSRDPAAHALLADLLLILDPEGLEVVIESIAARALAPADPIAWRRLAMVQIHRERYGPALETLNRYFALAGADGARDAEAQRWAEELKRRTPGGELAHEALRQ